MWLGQLDMGCIMFTMINLSLLVTQIAIWEGGGGSQDDRISTIGWCFSLGSAFIAWS